MDKIIMVAPGTYRHYKGHIYNVLGIAKHSETLEELVVYQSQNDRALWVRPLPMFVEFVQLGDTSVPRFERVGTEQTV